MRILTAEPWEGWPILGVGFFHSLEIDLSMQCQGSDRQVSLLSPGTQQALVLIHFYNKGIVVPGRALLVSEEAKTQEVMDFFGEDVGRDPPPHFQEKDLS